MRCGRAFGAGTAREPSSAGEKTKKSVQEAGSVRGGQTQKPAGAPRTRVERERDDCL